MNRLRRYDANSVIYAVLAAVIIVVGTARWLTVPSLHTSGFNVVWCAGQAVLNHRDPYLQEPIHSCEAAHGSAMGPAAFPAPQPPYAQALFALVALVPHDVALLMWEIAALLAACAVAWSVARLAGMPLWAAAAATVVPMLIPTVKVASVPPMALTLVVLAALALRYERVVVAVVLLALASVQINIAAPALLCLLIVLPKARIPVLVAGAVMAALSLLVLGPALCVEYVTRILPAQAAAETMMSMQYSLTALLAAGGVAESTARAIGGVQALTFITLGIVSAALLYRRDGDAAWLALLPAGFAAIGGVYLHSEEVAYAIAPLALLSTQRGAIWAKIGLILLSSPIFWAASIPEAAILSLVGPLLLLYWAFDTPWYVSVCVVGALWFGEGKLHQAFVAAAPHGTAEPLNAPLPPIPPDAPAAIGWVELTHTKPNPPILWLGKVPAMIGGLMLLPATALAALRKP
jgi:hypothetical protein